MNGYAVVGEIAALRGRQSGVQFLDPVATDGYLAA
jgi:hypothetical protein